MNPLQGKLLLTIGTTAAPISTVYVGSVRNMCDVIAQSQLEPEQQC